MKNIRNDTKICKAIWQHPGSSRADLAKLLRIDKSTVTAEIAELLKEGVIEELPKMQDQCPPAGTGRRPIPLSFDVRYGIVLGLSIQAGLCTVVAVNLKDEIVWSKEEKRSITAGNLVDSLVDIYRTFRKTSGRKERILGIGIGVGGLIDQKDFTIRYSVPLQVDRPFSFMDEASKKIPVPIVLENNANCCAWARLIFSHGHLVERNFLFLLLEFKQASVPHAHYGGVGIGLGIVLGGKIYYGTNSFAGEFRSAFCEQDDGEQMSLTSESMKHIMEDGQTRASFIQELAANIALLVNTMDIGHVQVGSDIEEPGRAFCAALDKAIERNWLFPVAKNVGISYSAFGSNTVAYGAAGKLVQSLFDGNAIP